MPELAQNVLIRRIEFVRDCDVAVDFMQHDQLL